MKNFLNKLAVAEIKPIEGVDPGDTFQSNVVNIINAAIGILGIVAVIIVIIGGIGYMTSAGDSGKITKARNTILYGIIGLVIVALAFALVNFVIVGIING